MVLPSDRLQHTIKRSRGSIQSNSTLSLYCYTCIDVEQLSTLLPIVFCFTMMDRIDSLRQPLISRV